MQFAPTWIIKVSSPVQYSSPVPWPHQIITTSCFKLIFISITCVWFQKTFGGNYTLSYNLALSYWVDCQLYTYYLVNYSLLRLHAVMPHGSFLKLASIFHAGSLVSENLWMFIVKVHCSVASPFLRREGLLTNNSTVDKLLAHNIEGTEKGPEIYILDLSKWLALPCLTIFEPMTTLNGTTSSLQNKMDWTLVLISSSLFLFSTTSGRNSSQLGVLSFLLKIGK